MGIWGGLAQSRGQRCALSLTILPFFLIGVGGEGAREGEDRARVGATTFLWSSDTVPCGGES